MEKKVRCVVIDDEPLAIQVVEKHIQSIPALDHVASFKNPVKAFAFLQENPVDLVFLDIQMPVLTGLDFVRSLPQRQAVIFTTAYRDFAVESYELDIVDYLLKPITFTRFFQAVNRYLEQHKPSSPEAIRSHEPQGEKEEAFLFVNANKKHVKVEFSRILFVESIKDYIRIHTEDKRIITKDKISEFAEKLPAEDFLRVHRSFIVNLRRVTAYSANDVEIGEHEIPIGVSYKKWALDRLKG